MKLYRIQRRQILPISVEDAWQFFSDPKNLALITPPWLNFTITSELPDEMYPGLIITYRIKPVMGIATDWVTEITHAQEPQFFIDEQRAGPYRFWHHQHFFRKVALGVEMEDLVHYALPFGPLGRLINRVYVHERLTEIFDFRRHALAERFGDPFRLTPPDQK